MRHLCDTGGRGSGSSSSGKDQRLGDGQHRKGAEAIAGRPLPGDGIAATAATDDFPAARGFGRRRWWPGLRRRANTVPARQLYAAIVAQARHPLFYEGFRVPDTPDGRYDMIVLHAVLVFRRLHADPAATELAQALFDAMFADFDESLREMGVGDLRVGKQVKALAKGLYGRIVAYGGCLDGGDMAGLADALGRNVYRHGSVDGRLALALAGYVAAAADHLAGIDAAGLAAGRLTFPPPPAP